MTISVIIPTHNERETINQHLSLLASSLTEHVELIVVDGQSTDGTPELAAAHARVIQAQKGRAFQMNAGAQSATSDWLLFLHADSILPAGWQHSIVDASDKGYAAGAFRLEIVGEHPLLPVLAWGANVRSYWKKIALGDQGLFIKRQSFEALGRFPELPMMEDYAFALVLKKAGILLYLAKRKVKTSGRRWEKKGFWRTWWLYRRCYFRFRHLMSKKEWEALLKLYQQ